LPRGVINTSSRGSTPTGQVQGLFLDTVMETVTATLGHLRDALGLTLESPSTPLSFPKEPLNEIARGQLRELGETP